MIYLIYLLTLLEKSPSTPVAKCLRYRFLKLVLYETKTKILGLCYWIKQLVYKALFGTG